MIKRKSTKQALLGSLVVLLLCVSMLVGTTYAWFTDSVTSAGNKIEAGTLSLDLSLFNENSGEYESIKESKTPIFNYDKWEPGYTEVKLLEVENEGTLALKWMAKFVSSNKLSELADVIEVYVLPSSSKLTTIPADRDEIETANYRKVGTVKDFVNTIEETTTGNLVAGAKAYLGIALVMPENAPNKYQGMDLGGSFDIKLLATQYSYEKDSFGEQYDEGASFYGYAKNAKALFSLMKNDPDADINLVGTINGETSDAPFGEKLKTEYTWLSNNSSLSGGKIVADEGEVFGVYVSNNAKELGSTIINDTKFEGNSESLVYIQASSSYEEGEGNVVLNSVSVKANGGSGIYAEYADNGLILNNCKVEQSGIASGNDAHFETALAAANGSVVTVNGGSYKSSRWAVRTFGSKKSTVIINGGSFEGKLMAGGSDEIIINKGTFSEKPEGNGVIVCGELSEDGGKWEVKPYSVETDLELSEKLSAGKSIKLGADIETASEIVIEKDTYIDLGGNTLSCPNESAFKTDGEATVSIKNGSIKSGEYSALVFGDSKLYAEEVVFDSKYGFSMNGSKTTEKSYAEFNNCEFHISSAYNAAYISAKGTYKFKNCLLEGGSGVLIRSGDVLLENCEIIANGYMGKGKKQPAFYANYEISAETDTLKDGIAYWDRSKSELSTGDPVAIIDNSGSGYDLKSVTIKGCRFEIVNSVKIDGESVPAGYAVRYLNRDPENGSAKLTFEDNYADGKALKKGEKGYVYSYYDCQ